MTIKLRSIAAVLMATCAQLAAAAWPEKPVTIIVPYAAGGLTDIVTRVMADEVGRQLGQPVVVDNRSGAGGKIGTEALSRAAKDGYTIGLAVPGTMVYLPATDKSFALQPLNAFEPITIAVDTFNLLAAHPNVAPSGSLKEFLAYANANPGKLNYGTPGAGTSFHFNSVVLAQKLGINAAHVPYRGEAPALADLAAGSIQYMLAGSGAKQYVDAGRIKPLAVTARKRVSAYPNVPTFQELGIDFKTDGWVGYIAPRGVPAPVLQRLNEAFVNAIKTPKVQEALAAMGYIPVGSTREEFKATIEQNTESVRKLVNSGAVKLE